jgi:hypothetical protein
MIYSMLRKKKKKMFLYNWNLIVSQATRCNKFW